MVIPYICMLIAAIMPMLFAGYAKFSVKGYDNAVPRDFLAKLQGKGKRAHAAHLNSFEAFPPFAAGVIVAHLSSVDPSQIAFLSVLFIIFRVIYGFMYIFDNHILRSAVWGAAFFCVVSLFVLAIQHA